MNLMSQYIIDLIKCMNTKNNLGKLSSKYGDDEGSGGKKCSSQDYAKQLGHSDWSHFRAR